ncbi:serine/threonine protein kinase [Streptomyces avermitilis]|uniref:non-specific serine/threonine protein kinase n=3 Tax=Streptomyces avermitilis TaxID=33903 RepID=Q81ZX9_STRAW|nr:MULTISPECIES: Stk1 family PASTA domain-containing Ser/Thr kinase [Streptomyces]KUN52869.1 serine/threonine protein kinase [Streptomyces avermitilis]MYS99929.1 Stk1 family PASTA domain-containing Ser/Thr kinase [Streptomyces sp. SID5469]OOV31854.1 serine/threonine protein kinase [Streptomyces avermitilis]BAC72050.1 putative serine/threonine protein kinase [Streptomyces avermitilis MA-4680 = NBRC 14893]GDY64376.1 putative serine/threonine-protein kinase [Streptomyces avermitilis]
MEEPRRLGGRYELGHVLGRGGMAEVHLAHDTRLGRTVAVKTLRADLARDPSFQARFRREAQSAASLNHPAIVAVYDTGEDYIEGISIPYIVMEYVDGSTLRELLHSGRKLLPERTLEMTIGILQALEYSHRAGIVHRDIKPANVMLTRNGQVKVMDFGIARAMGDSGMTMTQTAAVIGTAQYLSPEQAKGEQVDARSDLYSTGCLLYELLTVRPPFVGDSPVAVAYQHVREEPQPPSVFDPEITPEMDAIVLKALTKDPDYRYQSADEMRIDIEACLDGQPVAATAAMGSVGYNGYGDDQATTALRADAGATTMLPPMNPDDGGFGFDDRPDRRRQRDQKKSNTSTILLVVAGALVLIGAILIGKWIFDGDRAANDTVPAPNFVGLTLADAKQQAVNGDVKLSITKKPCEDQAKGNVCSQSPDAKTKVKKNSLVNLVLSTGAPKIAVPDVTGLTFGKAKSQLEDKGFRVEKKTEVSDQTPGVVTAQDPSGDSERQKGTTITLTVAAEAQKVTVPDVTGKSCDEAKQQMQANNLTGNCTEVDTSDASQAGKVIQTSPTAGTEVKKNSAVDIQVGKAPQQVAVPNLGGQSLKDAKKALQDAGLNVGNITGSQDDNAIVIASDPQAGTQVAQGTAVNLTAAGGNNNNGGNNNGGTTFFGGATGTAFRTED